ncbi:hypothetical protein K7X08_032644 [Anisodus acutangulus]|uniref:Uncharacterized protein n=1 Tax=Anisodus acutangulus TaxID=402998 RepID=A0A9Q1R9V5_9SOLA|nr:hypothetical protein K7X08_032644 [Anisodus acutangulus]
MVVGDRNGGVSGGLVDAPLKPTTKRRYQGTNNSFVFSDVSGQPAIFRPTETSDIILSEITIISTLSWLELFLLLLFMDMFSHQP